MGECPVLTSSFAAHFVSHFQATGLARPATASHDTYLRASSACKHYAAYDLENWKGMDRFHFNARITPQDWRDTYEPIFRSCVVDANVSSIMCSCNVSRHSYRCHLGCILLKIPAISLPTGHQRRSIVRRWRVSEWSAARRAGLFGLRHR